MRLTLCAAIAVVLILCILSSGVLAACPPCDVSYPSLAGSGAGPQGRTLLQIYIYSSWNIDGNGNSISGTNSNIWNAIVGYHDQNVNLNGATEMWNNATSGSNQIQYIFKSISQFFPILTSISLEELQNRAAQILDMTRKPIRGT